MTDAPQERPIEVLVDTMVATWTWFASRKGSAAAQSNLDEFGGLLTGRTLVINGQTRAELLRLRLSRPLSSEREKAFMETLDAIPYLPLNRATQLQYAEISEWAKKHAHPIAQKHNAADRWIAASAKQHGIPVASRDAVFRGIPGVVWLSKA